MALIKYGSLVSTGSAMNVNLGFFPSKLVITNSTKLASGTGVAFSSWQEGMASGSAILQTLTTGAPAYSVISTNGITQYRTPDASLYPPTNRVITAITKATNAQVTSVAHGFTSADINNTVVTFHNVLGMTQINTLSGYIQSVPTADTFTVNINTVSFSTYTSGGIANIITGIPATTQYANQSLNTAYGNVGIIGVTLGSGVVGSASDVLLWEAVLDAPFTS